MIETWSFCEDIKDIKDINDNNNDDYDDNNNINNDDSDNNDDDNNGNDDIGFLAVGLDRDMRFLRGTRGHHLDDFFQKMAAKKQNCCQKLN